MHGLLTTTKIMQCFGKTLHYFLLLFDFVSWPWARDTSTIEIRGKNAFRDRKAGLVKYLAD